MYDFWVTPDGGGHWQRQSVGLEDVMDRKRMADRAYGLFGMVAAPADPDHRLYLGTVRGLYGREPVTFIWSKRSGQAFDDSPVRELLVLDANPGRFFVTTPEGVFVYAPTP